MKTISLVALPVAFLAALMLGGCVGDASGDDDPTETPKDKEAKTEASGLELQTVGPCPFKWTCNHTTYYSNPSAKGILLSGARCGCARLAELRSLG